MKRRDTLKALALGGLAAGAVLEACGPADKEKGTGNIAPKKQAYDRFAEQQAHDEALLAQTFFTPEEMADIAILVDIIIPADEVSGSATEAGVPDFIEFMVKDRPEHQVPLRGGLRWLNLHCHRQCGKSFANASEAERLQLIDQIAYPAKAKPEMQQGVQFFNLMRDLTASGFYTTEMGWKDIGYMGNRPHQWKGVPEDVLAQYGLAYTQREEEICVKFDS